MIFNNQKLNGKTVLISISAGLALITVVEIQALNAKERAALPPQTFNAVECVRCHSDQKTINMMRMKEDGAGYLFNPDGTFKDPKLASLNKDYHAKKGGLPK